jgi:hypothetical protein
LQVSGSLFVFSPFSLPLILPTPFLSTSLLFPYSYFVTFPSSF